ncbi:MAG: carbohydrate kinase family protein [Sphaerochaeta sp.]|nr:carbohydrate kinase family protein [Sphaerochaeta sp.]
MSRPHDVMVGGHICIDMIPGFLTGGSLDGVLSPGKLINMGPMVSATGGVVPNTGGVLERFGLKTVLVGRVGRDTLGAVVLEALQERGSNTDHIRVSDQDATSYTIVLNIPGTDRIPLHCPGANDSFGEADIPPELFSEVRLFHFGYPPLMRNIFSGGGKELSRIFKKAKVQGVTTSLDMARPDPDSPSGQVDWREYLENVLPYVDIFHPSIDELIYMIDRPNFTSFEEKNNGGTPLGGVSIQKLKEYADLLLAMGPAVVAIKLGNCGLYVQVAPDHSKLSRESFGEAYFEGLENWRGKQVYQPCYDVDVVGAIGAGDCTIAGFLTGLLKGQTLQEAASTAVGAGSCNVEKADALSGIPDWETLQKRLNSSWKLSEVRAGE